MAMDIEEYYPAIDYTTIEGTVKNVCICKEGQPSQLEIEIEGNTPVKTLLFEEKAPLQKGDKIKARVYTHKMLELDEELSGPGSRVFKYCDEGTMRPLKPVEEAHVIQQIKDGQIMATYTVITVHQTVHDAYKAFDEFVKLTSKQE